MESTEDLMDELYMLILRSLAMIKEYEEERRGKRQDCCSNS